MSLAIDADQPSYQEFKTKVLTATCGTILEHGVFAVGHDTVITATCGAELDHSVFAVRYSTGLLSKTGVLTDYGTGSDTDCWCIWISSSLWAKLALRSNSGV